MECSFDPCSKPARHLGLCGAHYNQQNAGKPLAPLQRQGAGWINAKGYREIVRRGHPNATGSRGVILEHRWVMSEHLGRPLLPEEKPHHKNGDRADNRIENLELWSTSQPAGQRVSDKVEWARKILALYGDDYPAEESN